MSQGCRHNEGSFADLRMDVAPRANFPALDLPLLADTGTNS